MRRLLPLLFLCGCDAPSKDVFETYGLAETSLHRELAIEAVGLANQVIGPADDITLAVHWQALGPRAVPVYWVGSRSLSRSRNDMMFVLNGCRCIVVQPAVFLAWLSTYSGSSANDGVDLMELSPPHILAVFLLHEMGHIQEGHAGRALGAGTQAYTLDRSVHKDRETAADIRAAAALRTAGSDRHDFGRWWAARSIIGQLANLSFNLTGIRLIDKFGATSLALPEVFLDNSTSHPNFELRILEISHAIHDNDLTRDALVDFKAHQRRSADRTGVLYRRPAPDAEW